MRKHIAPFGLLIFTVLFLISCKKTEAQEMHQTEISIVHDSDAKGSTAPIFPESEPVDPDIVNGIWENRRIEDVRFTFKGNFSWGENVRSSSSVIIDLNSERSSGPFIAFDVANVLFVRKKEARGNHVVLTCNYYDTPNEKREITITVIDEDTISIDAGEYLNRSMRDFPPGYLRSEYNPNNYLYRVPVDTPYNPFLPGENLDGSFSTTDATP